MKLIEVRNLTKRYGNHTAVSDLSFTVDKGQIFGFLGPNGAGKSTTMNIMTGCLAATEGEILIGGFDIFEEPMKAKKLIGYLPEQPPLYLDRTPLEYLSFVGTAKGISKAALKNEVQRVMELTGITHVSGRLIKNLSKGYKQRVGIAQAILGDPEVIILDEPTVGLDPLQIVEIRELIAALGMDHTIILSSHILSEVQAVCNTIMIINKGMLVACDTPEALEARFAPSAVVSVTAECNAAQGSEILHGVAGVEETEIVAETDTTVSYELKVDVDSGDEVRKAVFMAFAGAGTPITQLSIKKVSLEDIFIELTNTQEEAAAEAPDEENAYILDDISADASDSEEKEDDEQ